ncbi:MAG: serine/threonine-protein phosphatase [Phycisphaerae bacterium]|jgi:serine phosphatase RsbU (regulator of sigma subunit)|nr:serine/threonine-protein phosphatase [Phycisphaerae bacterium]MCZ2398442.1 serine/threonine-protein phosphatase [Phycisphaerae bacterium]
MAKPQGSILVFDASPQRALGVLATLQQRGLPATCVDMCNAAASRKALPPADVALFVLDQDPALASGLPRMLEELTHDRVAALVWGWPEGLALPADPLVERVSHEATSEEVVGCVATLAHYAPMMRRLDRELDQIQRVSQQLNRYIGEIDQEMRLAGRLQHDFLPRRLPELPPLAFAALYRPASWVSGDIYDVFRADDTHAGIFLADAMGHGTAAALMTMFLRQALVTRRAAGERYELLGPAEALGTLHANLARKGLPNQQFVTAAYALIDVNTRVLRLARGGHPYPIHVRADGELREIQPTGGLIGLAEIEADFTEQRVTLAPGDRVIFYTDGMEDLLIRGRDAEGRRTDFAALAHEWARLGAQDMVDAIEHHLNTMEGSLHPEDDVSVVVVEVQR